MPYTPYDTNRSSSAPAISDERLDYMELGIEAAAGAATPIPAETGPVTTSDDVLIKRGGIVSAVPAAHSLFPPAPYSDGLHSAAQLIPNNVWTRVGLNTIGSQTPSTITHNAAATTIAVASNGAVLPQTTINVASTTGFAASGVILVAVAGGLMAVPYGGLTGTSFTGCTEGVGTLATGQAVTQLYGFVAPVTGVYFMTLSVSFAANATGDRGVRFGHSAFFFIGTQLVRATSAGVTTISAVGEGTIVAGTRVDPFVFQTSGGSLALVADTVNTPRASMRLVRAA